MIKAGTQDKTLYDLFASRMGEYELTGHLPKTEFYGNMAAASASTRVVNFGEYGAEPGSFFSGMLPSGKSAYITAEQQRGFISNVFGKSRMYRFTGSGAQVTPQQMRRIRIQSPQTGLDTVSDLTKFRERVEARLSDYKKLAELEKSGKITRKENIDPYSYKAGTPGKRGKMLEADEPSDDEGMSLFEIMDRDPIAEEASEEKEAAPEKIEFSPNMTREEMDKYAAQLTGMDFSSEKEVYEQVGGSQQLSVEPSYVKREGFYQNQYNSLREQYNKAFIFDYIKKPGMKKKERVLTGYHPLIKERFASSFKSMQSENIDLIGKSMDESEQIIEDAISRGGKVFAKEGTRYKEIESAPIENFAQLYLQDELSKEYKTLSAFDNPISDRAAAEQVFDAYFRKMPGRNTFGAYTAAGTFLGETTSSSHVPKNKVGAAKIFEYKGRYSVGFAADRNPFVWNRFGEVEQATLANIRAKNEEEIRAARWQKRKPSLIQEPGDINSILDLNKSQRLVYSKDVQDNLKKLYEQAGADYSLMGKYKYDKTVGSYVDVHTGEKVDKITADMYKANVENAYRRRGMAQEILDRPYVDTASSSSMGKIWNAIKGVSSRIPKTTSLIFTALEIGTGLVAFNALSNKKQMDAPQDASASMQGSSTTDQRMFMAGTVAPQTARIVPEYQGMQGYSTNINIRTTDPVGVNPSELAFVMDRHARQALGTKSSGNNVEINDNSTPSTKYALQQKYANMMSS